MAWHVDVSRRPVEGDRPRVNRPPESHDRMGRVRSLPRINDYFLRQRPAINDLSPLRRALQVFLRDPESGPDRRIVCCHDCHPRALLGEDRIGPARVDGVVMIAAARVFQHLVGLRIAEHGARSADQNLRAALVHQIRFVGSDRTAGCPLAAVSNRARDALAAA
jgi:hypothetical protein